ncbi:MAG TPA: ShlB/FhaC/HecB family hemolysin secretion/activation protein, partial [Acetobacteraceae bacterium]
TVQNSPAALVPQGSPLQRVLPPPRPDVGPGLQQPALPEPRGAVPNQAVRIASVSVVGATAYQPGALASLTSGLTGPAVPLSQVEQARQSILSRYREDGFVLSTVSANVDAAGNLRFTVVEGRIADVRLEGDIGPAGTQVLRFLRRLLDERPISAATLERYVLLATDVPGVTVRTVLRPSAEEPGALTLIAQVSRHAVGGLLAADNRAFRATGPEQLLAIGTFNSFTQFGERTELSLLHSFNNTQTFGQAATEFFVGGSGLRVRLYAGEGGVTPSSPLREVGYDGRTRVFGVQAGYPIIRRRQQTLSAVVAFDAIESDIRTDVPFPATRASFDSLRVLRAGADSALEDLLLGNGRPGINTVSLRLSQGLQGLGASQPGNPAAGRLGERPDFFKFNAEITRTQTLFQPWEGASVALFGLVAGQVSNSVLPPAEKFFLGGIRYNRGFYAGEVTGDNALTLSAELQLNTGFQFEAFGRSLDVNTQFYLFHDWGQTWENRSTDANRRLQSAGGGVRAQLTQYTEFDLEGVARFTRNPQGTTSTTTGGNTGRISPLNSQAVYWRVLTRF